MNGFRMINRVSNTIQVGRHLYCMSNCSVSPICDSYNYRAADKTCQLNTHDTQRTGSGLVLVTRRASSTLTPLRSSPTRPTLLQTVRGAGGAPFSPSSFELFTADIYTQQTLHRAFVALLCIPSEHVHPSSQ